MTTVCKIGGSLITKKAGDGSIASDVLGRIARTVADAEATDLVLMHGGGSFGHRVADRHGISALAGSRDPAAIRDVARAMDRLNAAVTDALIDAGVPAVSLPPRSAALVDASGGLRLASDAIAAYLDEDMVPVLHGDLVVTAGVGATVLSGDDLAVAVATELEGDRIGLCTSVPGVLDDDGEVVRRVVDVDAVDPYLGATGGTDVTGGMGRKVEQLLATEIEGAIFGIEQLTTFLDGEMPGTVVH